MEEYKVEVADNGTIRWFQDDKYHRLDGPAIEYADESKEWYQNGKLHRTDGPAIEHTDGYKAWYQDDKYHRLDGPAIEYASGGKEWYIEGVHYTEEKFLARTQTPRKVTMQEVIDQFGENVVIAKGDE